MTDEELEEIEDRAQAATPGPWGVYYPVHENGIDRESETFWVMAPDGEGFSTLTGWDEYSEEDAEFVAHSREDIPNLLAEIRRLRELLQS